MGVGEQWSFVLRIWWSQVLYFKNKYYQFTVAQHICNSLEEFHETERVKQSKRWSQFLITVVHKMCPYDIAFTTEKHQKPLCIFSSNVIKPHLHSSSKMRFPDRIWLIMGCLQNWGVSVTWGYSGNCNYLERITVETSIWGNSGKCHSDAPSKWRYICTLWLRAKFQDLQNWDKIPVCSDCEPNRFFPFDPIVYKILWSHNFKLSIKAHLH